MTALLLGQWLLNVPAIWIVFKLGHTLVFVDPLVPRFPPAVDAGMQLVFDISFP